VTGPAGVEAYLHRQIPLSREIGIRVVSVDAAGVRLAAPLEPNLNHQSTAFGGSVSCIAILSAWTLAHVRLREAGVTAAIVIQRNSVDYLKPVRAEMEAYCAAPAPAAWDRFVVGVRRRGRGRLRLSAEVSSEGVLAATFDGLYVALA
jgi:thioesterase domain-containing protein